ncbi:MAG: AraC family transcriptional regulator [Rikenellaceae bacterium]
MVSKRPWLDPAIKLEQLARMVGTNRTTLTTLIQSHGYEGFNDYIANYRIGAFCEFVKNNRVTNITNVFYDVGFQSSSSAYRHFKRIHKMTPNQYLNSNEL